MIATTKGSDSTLSLKIWLPHRLAIGNLLVHMHTQTVYTRVHTAHALACVQTIHMRAHMCTQTLCPAHTHTGTHTLTCAHTVLVHRGTVTLTRVRHSAARALKSIPPSVCDCLSFFLGFSTFDTFEKSRWGILWKYLILCVCVSTGIMDLGKNTTGVKCASHHITVGHVTPSRLTTAVLTSAAWFPTMKPHSTRVRSVRSKSHTVGSSDWALSPRGRSSRGSLSGRSV